MPAPPAKLTSGEKAALKKVKAKENKAKANPALAEANKVGKCRMNGCPQLSRS